MLSEKRVAQLVEELERDLFKWNAKWMRAHGVNSPVEEDQVTQAYGEKIRTNDPNIRAMYETIHGGAKTGKP